MWWRRKAGTPACWADPEAGVYAVQTAEHDGLPYGRLVNLAYPDEGPGPEVPINSIFGMLPYCQWQEFKGDLTPVLVILNSKGTPPKT